MIPTKSKFVLVRMIIQYFIINPIFFLSSQICTFVEFVSDVVEHRMSGHIENVDLQVPILNFHFGYAKIDPNRSHVLLIGGKKLS